MMETVWDAVARQAQRNPAALAVRGERDLSYRELLQRAAALADDIQARATGGAVVALDATTPVAAATAILAAARSRCAIVPLSADSPPARRAAVLSDASPSLILREAGPGWVVVEHPPGGLPGRAESSPQPDMASVAYVMYTSGTTGRPKGVMVPHQALLSRLGALARLPGFAPGESLLAMSAFTFDICLAELLLPLSTGGWFVAAPPEARVDPEIFARVVRAYQPSVIQATPSFWRLALAWGWEGAAGARLWSGGEVLTPSLARSLIPKCAQLWNVYGPTEATIWASAALITTAGSIHLGEPLPGAGLCLEGDDGELVSPAQPFLQGEILIYGDALARGYLNLPDVTAQQFRACRTPDGARRCYRTGDRGHYREDGTLQFLGRRDSQVKLRGNRIELAEIESVLEEHPGVREAAALIVGADHPERAHIAVWVAADAGVTLRQIRGWLSERLPASMRPGHISVVDALPRTGTGKIDRVRIASQNRTVTKASQA